VKGTNRVEHHSGEQAGTICLEEAFQATPDAVVVDQANLARAEPEHGGVEPGRPLVHRLQRLMAERQIADHDADRLGRSEAHPTIGCRDVLVDHPGDAEAGEEVVDHRQRTERLGV